MARGISLFTTRKDLETLITEVESKEALQYVLCYMAESTLPIRYSTGLAIPDLGIASVGSHSSEKRYLVLARESQVCIREITRGRFDPPLYVVNQIANASAIVFQPAGVFQNECVIEGSISTASTDPESLQRYKQFLSKTRKHFQYVSYAGVGPEAMQLFDQGLPLCQAAGLTPDYWLKRTEPKK